VTLPRLEHVEWGVTEDWVSWRDGDGEGAARAFVTERGLDESVAAAVVESAVRLDAVATEEVSGVVGVGVWLPDPSLPLPEATLFVRVFDPEPGSGRMTLDEVEARAARPPRERGVKVLDVGVSRGRVAAGDAVIQVLDLAYRRSRQVSSKLTWFVLPSGTDQMVVVEAETQNQSMFDAMSQECNTITDSLVVRVAQA
jgi:hypothetical protein